jgi:predicted nuclease of restriction endonuclease-like (RecB) superfamily
LSWTHYRSLIRVENPKYNESDVEQLIIDNLQKFLLELGHGFSFVARQQRITTEFSHYFIEQK